MKVFAPKWWIEEILDAHGCPKRSEIAEHQSPRSPESIEAIIADVKRANEEAGE